MILNYFHALHETPINATRLLRAAMGFGWELTELQVRQASSRSTFTPTEACPYLGLLSRCIRYIDMKIVSTFHPSSAVLSSVKCRLGSRDLEHLVVAKLNRLDVYSLRPHGLQHECFLNVWGKVCSVASIPISVSCARARLPIYLDLKP